MGESHHRPTTLYNDVLPRLRCDSFWRVSDRGLFRGVSDVMREKGESLGKASKAKFVIFVLFFNIFLDVAFTFIAKYIQLPVCVLRAK